MLEFLKEMIEYFCWEGYPVWKFLLIVFLEVVFISLVLTKVITAFSFKDDKDEDEELEDDDRFIFDVSIYEDFDIFTPLSSQEEKP